jgi:4-amino-4-deoxy-L-arabinose transferase-like glycosyltransferase
MATDWHNCWYVSFDPAGFLSVDKPPVAFWFQVLSVKFLGYHGLSLHLPQVIEGLLSVCLVYFLTRRVAGEGGGLLAALLMAVMPVCVAINRSNLADSCLVLVLLLSAWALLRAIHGKGWSWLLLSLAGIGIAFNVKLLAAFVVLPTFYLVYWLAVDLNRKSRMVRLFVAGVVCLSVAFSWPLLVDRTPSDQRPYVCDTQNNSAVSLALGSKGFQNVAGRNRPGPDAPPQPPGPGSMAPPPGGGPPGGPPGSDPGRLTGHGGRPGLFRMVNRDMAGHISWFFPFATVAVSGSAALGWMVFHLRYRFQLRPQPDPSLLSECAGPAGIGPGRNRCRFSVQGGGRSKTIWVYPHRRDHAHRRLADVYSCRPSRVE